MSRRSRPQTAYSRDNAEPNPDQQKIRPYHSRFIPDPTSVVFSEPQSSDIPNRFSDHPQEYNAFSPPHSSAAALLAAAPRPLFVAPRPTPPPISPTLSNESDATLTPPSHQSRASSNLHSHSSISQAQETSVEQHPPFFSLHQVSTPRPAVDSVNALDPSLSLSGLARLTESSPQTVNAMLQHYARASRRRESTGMLSYLLEWTKSQLSSESSTDVDASNLPTNATDALANISAFMNISSLPSASPHHTPPNRPVPTTQASPHSPPLASQPHTPQSSYPSAQSALGALCSVLPSSLATALGVGQHSDSKTHDEVQGRGEGGENNSATSSPSGTGAYPQLMQLFSSFSSSLSALSPPVTSSVATVSAPSSYSSSGPANARLEAPNGSPLQRFVVILKRIWRCVRIVTVAGYNSPRKAWIGLVLFLWIFLTRPGLSFLTTVFRELIPAYFAMDSVLRRNYLGQQRWLMYLILLICSKKIEKMISPLLSLVPFWGYTKLGISIAVTLMFLQEKGPVVGENPDSADNRSQSQHSIDGASVTSGRRGCKRKRTNIPDANSTFPGEVSGSEDDAIDSTTRIPVTTAAAERVAMCLPVALRPAWLMLFSMVYVPINSLLEQGSL